MKKNIPYSLIEIVEPILQENKHRFTIGEDLSAYYYLKDADENSNFFFKIQIGRDNSVGKYKIQYKPSGEGSLSDANTFVDIQEIKKRLSTWFSLLAKYEGFRTVFDDPILNAYQKEFENEFIILDADADFAPFNLDKQLKLEELLNNAQLSLENRIDPTNSVEVNDIISDIDKLRKEQGKLSKNASLKFLIKILAKIRKFSLEILREVLVGVKKEIVNEITDRVLGKK